jgi:regulator of protease activity HflC (stomatin/prohibitin superfamily)
MNFSEVMKWFGIVFIGFIAVIIMSAGYREFALWSQSMRGKAELAHAEQYRQIQIVQANAEFESAKLRAKAIEIIGAKAKKYPEYRYQEFLGAFAETLKEGDIKQIIYVPTEASIPIMEANRFQTKSK